MPPQYWLLALPLLLPVTFMSTLAEIRDEGHRIRVKRLWISTDVPKKDVVGTARSVLDGIGALQLKRFVFPWGKIYYVSDWSKLGVASAQPWETSADGDVPTKSPARAAIWSLAAAVSGFLAGRAMSSTMRNLRIEAPGMRAAACVLALALCAVFAVARTRRPNFASIALYVATCALGLIQW
jgi:hypothetical protein